MPCRRVRALALVLCSLAILGLRIDSTTSSEPQPTHVVARTVENPPPRPPEIERLLYDSPGPDGALPLPAHLRYPDAKRVSLEQPAPPPRAKPRTPEQRAREQWVTTYDAKTGEVYERRLDVDELLGPQYTQQGIGLHELLEDPEGVAKNFTDWAYVPDPTVGDYPRRVKLFLWFEDINGTVVQGGCSGTLIDPMHVLTAAHCIWSHEAAGFIIKSFAVEVEVVPGYTYGQRAFGDAGFSQMHVWTQWIDDQDFDHDIGIIDLDRPIGALTGWWGYGFTDDCGFYETELWRQAGYPTQAPFDGEALYENDGDFDDCALAGWDYRIQWEGVSYKGLSGTGALKTATGGIYAVLSTGDEYGTQSCRLSSTKYAQLGQIILDDKPPALDLIAMDVRSDETVTAGFRLGALDFLVMNYSQGTMSDNWPFDMYLSLDRSIATDDIYLGSGAFSYSFGDNGRVRVVVDPPPLIPPETPTGSYYLGVLLTRSDWNNANNASNEQEAHGIAVQGSPEQTPTQLSPLDGVSCLPPEQSFSWSPVAPLADYQMELGTQCGTGTILDTQQTSYTWSGLEYSTTYLWRVRSRSPGGSWSDWSPCWSFRTEANTSAVASAIAPVEGEHCLGLSATLHWTPLPDAVSYDVQYSPDGCYEGPIHTGIVGELHSLAGLSPDTTYYWRVRAHTTCGQTTDWSSVPGFCFTFKTAPLDIDPPVRVGPGDGTTCGSANTVLLWNHAEDGDHYEVQIGTSCGTGTIYSTVSNGFTPPDLQSGVVYYWRVRSFQECGLISAWTDCWSFSLDLQPPTNPTNLWSYSHEVGVWSNDNTIETQWDWGYDNCAGSLPQYATLWDTSPTSQPTEPTTSGEATLETSPPLPDGQNHWFHVRAVDWAGNLALDTLHLGPFWVDTGDPEAPEFDYSNLDPGTTTGPTVLILDWLPVVEEEASGVAGYSWSIHDAPVEPPTLDEVVDLTGTTITVELAQEVDYWFFLRAVDLAGNGSETSMLGPFTVDHDMVGVVVSTPARGDAFTEGELCSIRWDYYDDGAAYPTRGQLSYSLDAGQSYQLIDNLYAPHVQQKEYDWPVPAAGSTEAVVRLTLFDQFGQPVSVRSERFTMIQLTGVDEPPPTGLDRFALEQARPNPFNPQTTIYYTLPHATHVLLRIYDAQGRLVRTLVDREQSGPQRHEVVWDGRDDHGLGVASGVYHYALETPEYRESRRTVLVK